ncbi:hypothetical protein EMMF5_004694 [Cystobasidiomycetes sp. EMM_F5]
MQVQQVDLGQEIAAQHPAEDERAYMELPTYRFPPMATTSYLQPSTSSFPSTPSPSSALMQMYPMGMHMSQDGTNTAVVSGPSTPYDAYQNSHAYPTTPYQEQGSAYSSPMPAHQGLSGSESVASFAERVAGVPTISLSSYSNPREYSDYDANIGLTEGSRASDHRMSTVDHGYHHTQQPYLHFPPVPTHSSSLPAPVPSYCSTAPIYHPLSNHGHSVPLPPKSSHTNDQYASMSSPSPNFQLAYQSLSTTTHTTSHSTFIPSSAYLPPKSTFVGLSPQLPSSAPHSAPTTPMMGRQDARFLSSRGWSTPQPPSTTAFPPASMNAATTTYVASPVYAGTATMPSVSSTDFRESSPKSYFDHPDGRDYHPPALSVEYSTPYIPYARPFKTGKRLPYQSPSSSPGAKRSKKVDRKSNSPSAQATESPDTSEQKPRVARCKIACAACRKTRLRCDGKTPCTSCIEKHIKLNSDATPEEAALFIQASESCTYESFVRRRGKGKKTLDRERDGSEVSAKAEDIGYPMHSLLL